ncbi:hypothetical protein CEXT_442351 [Caerostris extrusa]|uniref:Uncharacterized protein n=1 Tax=Caerostris extrusa TaxID=172846 RepID=A0AAV4MKH8_CAEEX|nr:hypothetical protein CEXT_442351 [Caerostris extrusa]
MSRLEPSLITLSNRSTDVNKCQHKKSLSLTPQEKLINYRLVPKRVWARIALNSTYTFEETGYIPHSGYVIVLTVQKELIIPVYQDPIEQKLALLEKITD